MAILSPGLVTIFNSNLTVSDAEKRNLIQPPNFPLSPKEITAFPNQFDAYYQDNFGFRTSLLTLYHQLRYWLKDSSGSEVIYGSEPGWLFYTNQAEDPLGDFRNINQFTQQNLDQFISNLAAKQQWLAQQGIEYLFVLTPSKHYIYPEFLPDHLQRLKQTNLKAQLAHELKRHPEINYLDLTETLWQHKNQQRLYFKADTHWNYYAGNIAQYTLIERLNQILNQVSTIRRWQADEFKFQFNHHGDLAVMLKAGPQFAEPLMKPNFSACADIGFDQLLAANSQYSTNCQANKPNVLVFHDSFFNLLQPFISTHFGQVKYLKQRFNFESAELEIKNMAPDVVIEQYVDRFLPTIYHP